MVAATCSRLTMATQLSRKRALESPSIPDRLDFKIGDVAKICDVETYVLRFWESQFPNSSPTKVAQDKGFTAAAMWNWPWTSSDSFTARAIRFQARGRYWTRSIIGTNRSPSCSRRLQVTMGSIGMR